MLVVRKVVVQRCILLLSYFLQEEHSVAIFLTLMGGYSKCPFSMWMVEFAAAIPATGSSVDDKIGFLALMPQTSTSRSVFEEEKNNDRATLVSVSHELTWCFLFICHPQKLLDNMKK